MQLEPRHGAARYRRAGEQGVQIRRHSHCRILLRPVLDPFHDPEEEQEDERPRCEDKDPVELHFNLRFHEGGASCPQVSDSEITTWSPFPSSRSVTVPRTKGKHWKLPAARLTLPRVYDSATEPSLRMRKVLDVG